MQIPLTRPDMRTYFGCAVVNVGMLAPVVNGHHSFFKVF